jgi:hypothetical protein
MKRFAGTPILAETETNVFPNMDFTTGSASGRINIHGNRDWKTGKRNEGIELSRKRASPVCGNFSARGALLVRGGAGENRRGEFPLWALNLPS